MLPEALLVPLLQLKLLQNLLNQLLFVAWLLLRDALAMQALSVGGLLHIRVNDLGFRNVD